MIQNAFHAANLTIGIGIGWTILSPWGRNVG